MRPRARLGCVLAAHTTSSAGNTATAIAVPLHVLQTTGSTALVGVAAAVALVPVVLGGVFGGVLVDRAGYRRTSIASDLVGAVTIGLVPLLDATAGLPFGVLLALLFATGLLDTPGQAARHAVLPELAAESGLALDRVTGWMDAAERLARLLGAPLAGVLVGLTGALTVLALDAVTFLVSALLVAVGAPAVARAARVRTGYWREMAEGLAFVRGDRLLRAVVLLVACTNAFDAAFSSVVLPVVARERFGGGPALGLLVGAFGAGAVLGALTYGAVGTRFPRRTVFAVAFLLVGAPRFLVLAADPGLVAAVVTMVLTGVAAGAINPILGAAELERVPPHARARVAGVVGAGAWAAMPIGQLGTGVALEHAALPVVLLALGGAYLVVTLWPFGSATWAELDRVPSPTSP
ncbi:MFS transporter [Paenibacillus sp. TRM 82003]|uniref:MFS transporter n=1 Tax=Kineococcus sp. TRM81007 TaxID=2925831 RepID=UPI001F5907FA|nr:MFS transporter [Kineococcus sp. TRM81007]MCI2239364.1 MFS transporter [Kineococcus sp. TRM81007]MCI3925046.1 MFS transporter [Paenibacillus sp. TRM 82003]